MEFVPQTKISEQWYDRPYYLGPDGDEKDYFALAEALQKWPPRAAKPGVAERELAPLYR